MEEIKVRKCIQCQKWVLEDNTKRVEVGGRYIPPYSGSTGEWTGKYGDMCKVCIKKLNKKNDQPK